MQDTLENVTPRPVEITVWDTGIEPLPRPQWREWKADFYNQIATGKRENSPRTEDSYSKA